MKQLGVSFVGTTTDLATFFATSKIQPLMQYVVDGTVYYAKQNVNGAYAANDGTKHDLVKVGSMQSFKVTDGATISIFGDNDILTLTGSKLIDVALSGSTATITLKSGSATAGQFLAADGSGGASYVSIPANYVTSVTNTATANATVSGDQLTVNTRISDFANNLVKSDANGLYVAPLTIGTNAQSFLDFDSATNTLNINAIRHNQKYVATQGFATWISSVYASANYPSGIPAARTGDIIIDTLNITTWMLITDISTGTSSDWKEIQGDVTASVVRQYFSSSNAGIAFDSTTGEFGLTVDPLTSGASITSAGLKITPSAGAVVDIYGISNHSVNYPTTIQALFDETAKYAKKLYDGTAPYFYLKGADDLVYKFDIDANGVFGGNAIPSGVATSDFIA